MHPIQQALELSVFLAVESDDHSSADLDTLIGLDGDERWDRGSTYKVGGKEKSNKFSRWAIAEYAAEGEFHDLLVERLVKRARPFEQRFRQLPKGVRLVFSVYRTGTDTVFGFGLAVPQLQFLASIGAEVDLSFVVCEDRSP